MYNSVSSYIVGEDINDACNVKNNKGEKKWESKERHLQELRQQVWQQ